MAMHQKIPGNNVFFDWLELSKDEVLKELLVKTFDLGNNVEITLRRSGSVYVILSLPPVNNGTGCLVRGTGIFSEIKIFRQIMQMAAGCPVEQLSAGVFVISKPAPGILNRLQLFFETYWENRHEYIRTILKYDCLAPEDGTDKTRFVTRNYFNN